MPNSLQVAEHLGGCCQIFAVLHNQKGWGDDPQESLESAERLELVHSSELIAEHYSYKHL